MVLFDFMMRICVLSLFSFILFCVIHVFMSEKHVCRVKTMARISSGAQELCSCVSSADDWLVQFSSRWYLCARKSPYALHPVSQKFPQRRIWNGSSVRLIDDGPLSSFQGRSSSASSFHASLLQAIDGVMSLALCPLVVSLLLSSRRSVV